MKVFFLFLIAFSGLNAIGIVNFETSIQVENKQTLSMIKTKKKEVLKEAKEYKQNLKLKKLAMVQLLKRLLEVETIMIKNQLKRKKIIQEWKGYFDSQNNILQRTKNE